jgi:uncharacterized protein (TIGR03000 family)
MGPIGFRGPSFRGASFRGAAFRPPAFRNPSFRSVNFPNRSFQNANFRSVNFPIRSFRNANLARFFRPRISRSRNFAPFIFYPFDLFGLGYGGLYPNYPFGLFGPGYGGLYPPDFSAYGYGSPYGPEFNYPGIDFGNYGPSEEWQGPAKPEDVLPPPAPLEPQPPTDGTALIRIILPADAELWVQGKSYGTKGTKRDFSSPKLTPGKPYSYVIKARWKRNGRTIEESGNFTVRGNNVTIVKFPLPQD